jgi:hypothetical protein
MSMTGEQIISRQQVLFFVGSAPGISVVNEAGLRETLTRLSLLDAGQEVGLRRGAKDYIKAIRRDDLWSVTTRHGSYLTLASFTASSTTDYSDRRARAMRNASSIWGHIKQSFLTPPPEWSLSTAQVQTLFIEYFLGKRFSIPQSGA